MLAVMAETRTGARGEPPIKVACLACRASRIRCDGKPLCRNCANKGRSCVYTKSNRGGPRISRKRLASLAQASKVSYDKAPTQARDSQLRDGSSIEAIVEAMIFPGAGLQELDKIDMNAADQPHNETSADSKSRNTHPVATVRTYQSDDDLLDAYYVFVHDYFPILPPSRMPARTDKFRHQPHEYQPSSPISLALSSILALIPSLNDELSSIEGLRLARREQAQLHAQLAMESIEIESEILESETHPSKALSSCPTAFRRKPFHPDVPAQYESLLALLILSIYEYAQRGNVSKMRNRASQALDAATRMSLHEIDGNDHDKFKEATSRAWWMTYVCVLQSCIVSNTTPFIDIDYTSYTTPLPTCHGDSSPWRALLEAQQTIMKCTLFTAALKKSLHREDAAMDIKKTMHDLDDVVKRRLAPGSLDIWETHGRLASSQADEQNLIHALQVQAQIKLHSARIKLYRYHAFNDAPLFEKSHCDLSSTSQSTVTQSLHGSCETEQEYTLSSTMDASSSVFLPDDLFEDSSFHTFAVKRCYGSALAISRAFQHLPSPRPIVAGFSSCSGEATIPRTMPSFACCAMQGSYVLLMLCLDNGHALELHNTGRDQFQAILHKSLEKLIGVLDSYCIAFEAIQGMRNQVQEAYEKAKMRNNSFMSI
ncbi:hypothetical protein EJ04DRAFT_465890 [Polyplosphaeria fusca]|uniref:Zn(2)-C6 fungal-type domain-containing protein n=1 Tax=Polyplosphaeria fusca TaxID=682080 RepID=A0A9P4V412_9PLEO|nr:hypothetical protein EJ04DRAFT_465890 [Polyplosphaeria fusca]